MHLRCCWQTECCCCDQAARCGVDFLDRFDLDCLLRKNVFQPLFFFFFFFCSSFFLSDQGVNTKPVTVSLEISRLTHTMCTDVKTRNVQAPHVWDQTSSHRLRKRICDRNVKTSPKQFGEDGPKVLAPPPLSKFGYEEMKLPCRRTTVRIR